MFPAAGVPKVPYTPCCLGVLLPPIQVHSRVEGLSSQRSLKSAVPLEVTPVPPKSQKLPLISVQLAAEARLPGVFPVAGVPNVPYTPVWPHCFEAPITMQFRVLLPPTHAHSWVRGLNSQISSRVPYWPALS